MKSKIFFFFLLITLGLLAWGTYQALEVAPPEATMGDAQRIFYYHVPAATAASILFWGNFIASLWYLWKRSPVADALAVTGAEVGVVFFGVVLISGPIWARYAWGTFWVWDARLTTSLILWLLYMSYLVLRRSSEAGSTSVMAASMAILAALDMPIVYMSNRWFRTNHPQPMIGTPNLNPEMQKVLLWNMLAFTMFALMIAWFRYELERTSQKVNHLHIQKAAQTTSLAMIAPVALFFQDEKLLHEKMVQHHYMVAGYIAVWTIYISYLLYLARKLARLKKEEAELR
ncbi:MAG TPA: cytochrome c biogenesis protein CcsA, partial [Candidatus Angelobacter sp.]|nr:cytochrome c biogenesis protein CcsA [Candidatus Angelobacter sp.]